MRLKDLLQWAAETLGKHNDETPRLDAEVLLSHATKRDRLQLYLDLNETADSKSESYYRTLIEKRSAHMPVSYLTGHKEFMSLDFVVNQSVLIPRPETEILVETVSKLGKAGSRVLELGTGSGAIAVSLARYNNDWRIVATDVSMEALLIARKNACFHGVMERVSFLQADLFSAFPKRSEEERERKEEGGESKEVEEREAQCSTSSVLCSFDWVVSNPPYIPTRDLADLSIGIRDYEPMLALDGGSDGLDVIRRIIAEGYILLKLGGRLAMEIGYGQSEDIQKIVDETGKYSDYSLVKDYSGIPRIFHCARFR